ncbi:unnamed protein product [Boreogadus saida]
MQGRVVSVVHLPGWRRRRVATSCIMGEWTILERLLEAAVQQHSTMIGRLTPALMELTLQASGTRGLMAFILLCSAVRLLYASSLTSRLKDVVEVMVLH